MFLDQAFAFGFYFWIGFGFGFGFGIEILLRFSGCCCFGIRSVHFLANFTALKKARAFGVASRLNRTERVSNEKKSTNSTDIIKELNTK